jgi:hypothetical protein
MKTFTLTIALMIAAFGAIGLVSPPYIVWVAEQSLDSGALFFVAIVRITFGALLISAAATSRMPKTLNIIGIVVLLSGVATIVMAMFAVDRVTDMVDWWIAQGSTVVRLTAIPLIAVGSFIAYACIPQKKTRSADAAIY